ncbi:MAG TPA: right-handed parallel beta-helix repeat-containing protein [Candidatus Paceibacterota bacterium]|nr:right-handed parallel beta-helix repeat-containing protein [Verrucomicrobiota bacterium]HRY52096.1 right-handed parallel beta-helix repeat-containing protein [Candidatus Paceibacterota bacterium]
MKKHLGTYRAYLHLIYFLCLELPLIAPGASLGAGCDPILTFADGRKPVREVFVSPTGSDMTGKGSMAEPFKTLARAAEGVRAGDAIRLLPGTYQPGTTLTDLAGRSDAPIWIGGVAGQARPVVAGGNVALHLVRPRYLVVENLEIRGAAQNGINCDDGGRYADPEAACNVLFRNLAFHDIGTGGNQDGLKLSGLNDYQVLDCEFARMSAGGSGIDHVGCHRGVIARCRFTDMGSNSIQCKGGSADIVIRGNRFLNGGQRAVNIGGSTGFEFFRPPLETVRANAEARNIRVIANLFQGSDAPLAFVGAVDCIAAHNTLIEPRRWVMRILQETTSSGVYAFLECGSNQFVNNLAWFDRSRLSTFVNVGPRTSPVTFAFSNNLWYAFNNPGQSRPDLPAPENNGITGRDPLFVDAPAGDYSLATNSPAAGRGVSLPGVKADLREDCYADPPSIGAFEARPAPSLAADADADGMPDAWELAHGFDPLDADDAQSDADSDTLSNLGEHAAGTHPLDPKSVFRLSPPSLRNQEMVFSWLAVTGRLYRIESSAPTQPLTWEILATLSGKDAPIEFSYDTEAGPSQWFRVRVEIE